MNNKLKDIKIIYPARSAGTYVGFTDDGRKAERIDCGKIKRLIIKKLFSPAPKIHGIHSGPRGDRNIKCISGKL